MSTVTTCPEDCSDNLPVVAFDDCNPNAIESEINMLYIAKPTAIDFTDVTDLSEWTHRLSETDTVPTTTPTNTTTVGNLIRPLTVIGNRPAPTAITRDISNQRQVTLRKDFVINIKIDEITPANLALQRKTECGNFTVKAWYSILGGLIFGGDSGELYKLSLDLVLAEGSGEVVAITGTLTRRGKFTEEASVNPMA